MNRRAFTLVEILGITAIIAIIVYLVVGIFFATLVALAYIGGTRIVSVISERRVASEKAKEAEEQFGKLDIMLRVIHHLCEQEIIDYIQF